MNWAVRLGMDVLTMIGYSILVLPYLLLIHITQPSILYLPFLVFPSLLISMIIYSLTTLLLPRLKAGKFQMPGHPMVVAWVVLFAFKRSFSLPIVHQFILSFSFLRIPYYWLCGAKVASNAMIANDVRILDMQLTSIEGDTNIGASTIIGCHLADSSRLVLGPVNIKRGVQLGAFSKVGPNVTIEEECILGLESGLLGDITVGKKTLLGHNVVIERNVKIGERCYIGSHVRLCRGTVIEDNVVINGNLVISKNSHIKSGSRIKESL